MEKKKGKKSEKQPQIYEIEKQRLLDGAKNNIFPTPSEYQIFYRLYLDKYGQYLRRCPVCNSRITPIYPPTLDSFIDLKQCANMTSRNNCPVLLRLGLKKRCYTITVTPEQTICGDAFEMVNGAIEIGPWGTCRDFPDKHSKSIILENFLFSIQSRSNKKYCSPQCKRKHDNQAYIKKNPEKKKLANYNYEVKKAQIELSKKG